LTDDTARADHHPPILPGQQRGDVEGLDHLAPDGKVARLAVHAGPQVPGHRLQMPNLITGKLGLGGLGLQHFTFALERGHRSLDLSASPGQL
jgi:hypothetical protein